MQSEEESVGRHSKADYVKKTQFVGRKDELKKLDEAWFSHVIFIIHGFKGIGKSRLVNEFIDKKRKQLISKYGIRQSDDKSKTECNQDVLQVIYLDMLTLKDSIEAIYSKICASLNLKPEPLATKSDKWQLHIVTEVENSASVFKLFYLDNAEKVVEGTVRDEVLSLCQTLAKQSSNLKIVVTTTTMIRFSQMKDSVCSMELLPLKISETSLLMKVVAPHARLSQHEEDVLVKNSEGIPRIILMIGSELEQDGGLFSPELMAVMLTTHKLRTLSRDVYPKEDQIADVYKNWLDNLPSTLRNRMSVLQYIPGSFTISEAVGLLGYTCDEQTLTEALIPLRDRSMLNYDPTTKRFCMFDILKECIKTYFDHKHVPDVRARYNMQFSRVMTEISHLLKTAEYPKALAAFKEEQPNLRQLLQDVSLTNKDNYHFVIEVTANCTDLIEMFLRDESEKFYDGCLQLADRYGREEDKAVIHIAVGSFATNIIGDLPRGAARYESALQVIRAMRDTHLLAKVYQRKGWNLYQEGRIVEAIWHFERSLEISTDAGKELQKLYMQSLNSMGLACTDLGNFEEAQKYHFESLELRKQLYGEDHPMVGATLNNIGEFYKKKGEREKALGYYLKGLEIKRNGNLSTSSLVVSFGSIAEPTAIVDSLKNIALAHSDLKHWESAHKHLDEAMEILKVQKIKMNYSLALTYDTRGKVLMSEGKFDEACEMFEKASEIREIIAPSGIAYFESQLHLAQAKQHQGKYNASRNIIQKVFQLPTKALETMTQNSVITDCLECLESIFEKTGEEEKCMETLVKIQSELLRLKNFHKCQLKERQVKLSESS